MKTIIALLFPFLLWGQIYTIDGVPEEANKEPYNFIVQYWSVESGWKTSDGIMSQDQWQQVTVKGFHSLRELLDWINTPTYSSFNRDVKDVKVKPDKLIQIIDVLRKEQIYLKYRKEKHVKEKEVVIEKEEWTDYWYEID